MSSLSISRRSPFVLPLRFFRSPLSRGVLLGLALLPSMGRAQEDPAEVMIGERLFLETRFAERFAAESTGVNEPLEAGDPVVDTTMTTAAPLPGPFAGQSINCRACHLVDEQLEANGGGMRTYADFARRSPIPARSDGRTTAPRNSPALVNASLPRAGGVILHFDGEFASIEDLVRGTLTGRNYGWLPNEHAAAIEHIARVIREDDGSGDLAQAFGGAYRDVFAGSDPELPAELVLPDAYRIDVDRASDAEVVDAVAKLIAAYVEQLVFATDDSGRFVGSPYDEFLRANGLPVAPKRKETTDAYSRRLRAALERLRAPVYVDQGPFAFHAQNRVFGPLELRGLRAFLATAPKRLRPVDLARGGIGNCATCHPAPAFTDFGFHNTGVSQREYDDVHGVGRFTALEIPAYAARNADPIAYLPATAAHPDAVEPFRAPARIDDPARVDLGVWNVVGNPDMPAVQTKLQDRLCRQSIAVGDFGALRRSGSPSLPGVLCGTDALVDRAIARFKTPGLRDLSHSAPYLHDGSRDTLEGVLAFYAEVAVQAREGQLRNGAPELRGIVLRDGDAAAIVAFLRSLNEDYE